jgi:DNA uptake protein ComE-like DNA-binding protein
MTRFRFAGIAGMVLALAGTSLLTAQTKSPAPAPAATKTQTPKQVKLKPIDINSAMEEDLVLVGIDRPSAKKIMQARPFRSKYELVSKQLLTHEQYDKVKDTLVAKQPPKKK